MAREKFPLKGYTLPLTPGGKSSLVEPPPWHYGGEVMQLIFRTDEARARELIPPPLEMGPESGKGIVWFVEWISVSQSNPDLAFINPERAIYQECMVMIQCSFRGELGYFVPYIWVDNDFTLMRGFVQGFPKKLCRLHRTRFCDLTPGIGGKRVGAKMKGICQAHGERIVEGSLVFTRRAEPSELPPVKFYLMRHFPNIEDASRPTVHELAVSEVSDVRVDEVWAGEADLKFFESEVEEVAALAPVQMMGGFSHRMGLTITGGKVIHRYV
ncbi:MAG: acetoacetate decarboxylase family protein [Dehalococcoidia bacterium]|nr:acetoacetate decarboxylase family protein [Dehalococcoidia bacterium]